MRQVSARTYMAFENVHLPAGTSKDAAHNCRTHNYMVMCPVPQEECRLLWMLPPKRNARLEAATTAHAGYSPLTDPEIMALLAAGRVYRGFDPNAFWQDACRHCPTLALRRQVLVRSFSCWIRWHQLCNARH